MKLMSVSGYTHELRAALPPALHRRVPARLLRLLVDASLISLAATVILRAGTPWWLDLLASLAIGAGFASLTFLAHEVLHGAVVRSKKLQYLVGVFGFAHFMLSPRLWIAWHNRAHHAVTQQAGIDPDAYPTIADCETGCGVDWLWLGGGRLTGLLSLLFGFTFQSLSILVSAHRRGYLTRRRQVLAIGESVLMLAGWVTLAVAVGPSAFVLLFVLPAMLANSIVMTFILSNHCLSPLTATNDPLINTLSVTAPKPIEWLTHQFGYHVEHHLFPAMCLRYGPLVRSALLQRWPERYQSMPVLKALARLHRTARLYKDATTLIDHRSGREWPTLLPREPSPGTTRR